uniref:Uncharacterized protein n=1 Tax=Kalanchoe fedtschenkoi TaxID=63787 RepID=A0A7N0UD78_KALFE
MFTDNLKDIWKSGCCFALVSFQAHHFTNLRTKINRLTQQSLMLFLISWPISKLVICICFNRSKSYRGRKNCRSNMGLHHRTMVESIMSGLTMISSDRKFVSQRCY